MGNPADWDIEGLMALSGGSLPSHTPHGSYPVYYVVTVNVEVCNTCAMKDLQRVLTYRVNWDKKRVCQYCGAKIESAMEIEEREDPS